MNRRTLQTIGTGRGNLIVSIEPARAEAGFFPTVRFDGLRSSPILTRAPSPYADRDHAAHDLERCLLYARGWCLSLCNALTLADIRKIMAALAHQDSVSTGALLKTAT